MSNLLPPAINVFMAGIEMSVPGFVQALAAKPPCTREGVSVLHPHPENATQVRTVYAHPDFELKARRVVRPDNSMRVISHRTLSPFEATAIKRMVARTPFPRS